MTAAGPRQRRPRLRVAPPSASLPDTRAAVARALLGPVHPVVDDHALAAAGFDLAACARLEELETDPRYLIGRLSQALTALLQHEVPPLNGREELLGEALDDAISFRQRSCPQCPPEGVCAGCADHWRRAARYEVLGKELGLFGDLPRPRDLRAVTP